MNIEEKINRLEEKLDKLEEDISLLLSVSTSISKALNYIIKTNINKEEANRELINSLHLLVSNLSTFFKDMYELLNKKEKDSFVEEHSKDKGKITIH